MKLQTVVRNEGTGVGDTVSSFLEKTPKQPTKKQTSKQTKPKQTTIKLTVTFNGL